ncbi:MAG: hypothetical protein GY868_11630, partial [Deltaproteobacteria bacterium]|nr:hypothetical protein [Deltaproteobacteria bacterium]
PDAFIHCTLSDTGCGIPEEYRLKIFDPFFSTKEQGKGTGLGLSNVQRLIESAGGGRIRLGDTPANGGTSFIIEFPIHTKTPE